MTKLVSKFKGLLTLIFVSGILLVGCSAIRPSNDYASGWVGSPMERFLVVIDRNHAADPKNEPSRQDLMKASYTKPNGNIVYVSPEHFKRCNIHWEVNPAGIIVGYHFEEVVKGGCNW